VLTADAGLWLGCRKYGVPTFLPLELIRRWDGIALQTMVFGVAPKPAAGSLFVHVSEKQNLLAIYDTWQYTPNIRNHDEKTAIYAFNF
jgi:hypothetical protein